MGQLILRVLLAALLLFHGTAKLLHGVGAIEDRIVALGLPHFLAYGVYLGEVVAPILILVGLYTQLAALFLACNMIVAVLLVHASQFFTLSHTGGWALELQAFYFFVALALMFLCSPQRARSAAPDCDGSFSAAHARSTLR